MQKSNSLPLALLFFSIFMQDLQAEARPTQIWSAAGETINLDATEKGHTWWATPEKIDPATTHREVMLANEDYRGWYVAKTPTDLNEISGTDKSKPFRQVNDAWQLKTFIAPATVDKPLALRLGIISDRDRVYLNGKLIGETGAWDSPLGEAYDRIRVYDVPPGLIIPGAKNTILVHIQRYFPKNMGIYRDTTIIGPAAIIYRDFYNENFSQLILLAIYLTAGGYFLFLFIRRQKERQNLFFGLFVFLLVVYQFLRNQIKYQLPFTFTELKRVEYIVLFLVLPLFYYFLRAYFQFKGSVFLKWWDRWVVAISCIFGGLVSYVIFTNDALSWDNLNTTVVQPLWIFYMAGSITILVNQMINRKRDAFYIMGGFLVILGAMLIDILSERGYFIFPRVMGYAFIFFIMSLALILANHFVRLNEEVEDLNRNLEAKVEKRTEELRQTLNEVQTLKVQQDGDYFLTSLLIKPLSGNFGHTRNVSIDMLFRQKKKFHFKKWESEIGGDISTTDKIELRGRSYTVFINADAMGKSIQGAGGALVLGTVFKSILTRTQQSSAAKNKHPEQFLKDVFIEFQNVFISFDGTMLMSAVMGLVDDATGLVYFINAEHPWVVLYKNNKASFIEKEMLFRKLGISNLGGQIQIQTFQMERDDVLILGSDGRDDILTSIQNDVRIINEDEKQFLRRVEEGKGNLEEIEEAIYRQGQLTDDFTMVRIAFKEDHALEETTDSPEAKEWLNAGRKRYRDNAQSEAIQAYEKSLSIQVSADALRELGQIYFKLKDFANASQMLEQYLESNPADTEFLYYLSYSLKQERKYLEAADQGERCRLRSPAHLKNLLNLADVYRLLENHDRARMLLDLCRQIDPSDLNIKKLEEALQKASFEKTPTAV